MRKLLFVAVIYLISISTLYAENQRYSNQQKVNKIDFGQSIFRKKLQRKCGFTAGHWAQQHTKQEWISFQDNGTFKKELTVLCPKNVKVIKDKWIEPLYLFAVEYAKDTGNRPRC